MIRIWAISDTHCKHLWLDIPDPKDIDMVIHAGDAGGHRDLSHNDGEMREFLQWYENLPYKYKIYVPGNHDTSVQAKFHDFKDYPSIIKLEHESVEIEGVKIFGSPHTPSFGSGWSYNVPRHKLDMYWEVIPKDTNIIVTHGPPKGVLDYTAINSVSFTQCGCKALLNHVLRVNPKYHIFGHLHDEPNVLNCGRFKPNILKNKTEFVNASVMSREYKVVNNGIYLEYEN